jgi:hypothetical protein
MRRFLHFGMNRVAPALKVRRNPNSQSVAIVDPDDFGTNKFATRILSFCSLGCRAKELFGYQPVGLLDV